ncbi:unnamed protein product [Didymodactylos carnosus]|uniref:Uncharacterized protein n=1 Tax=Didymodactylos carnosus TaxID=1234261 RepID=A0A813P1B7_9BILA|nr:unnamed protein product [Didymodactylos carnosus]CAF0747586.1 unnamed protein product [Didymodactylos carnosus]CAF3502384.1 unnamed protein product [Didymodactylos carnosus]CAF3526650.1 unnamed protein product [Didymodactylos carnosus]
MASQKIVYDLLISVFCSFLLSTCLLSISTSNWNVTTHPITTDTNNAIKCLRLLSPGQQTLIKWIINTKTSIEIRTGLFQTCFSKFCASSQLFTESAIPIPSKRTLTLAVIGILLLFIGTLTSFIMLFSSCMTPNQTYALIPLSLFFSGVSMTLVLIQTIDTLNINGYSGYIYIIDTVLSYVLAGIALVQMQLFYI